MYNPKAFRVTYIDDVHHRVSTMGGLDSEYSHTSREAKEELIVAPDLEVAQFMWSHRNGHNDRIASITWEELGNITLMIPTIHGLY